MANRKEIPRELSIYINDRQVVNSLGGITREISKVNNEMRNLNKNSASYDEDLQRLQKDLASLKDSQAAFKEEIYETTEATSAVREGFTKMFLGFTSGNFDLVKEGFSGVKDSMGGMTKAALTFAASPVGLLMVGLGGLFAGAKAVFDYNKGLQEFNSLLSALGVNAKDISAVRSEIQATADTFGKEFGDIAKKADSLAESFGISISEANQIIAEGLANGGAKNEEFLDSLGEYDVFFAQAGYSAKEFTDILNAGLDVGIYSDKLPDALKEADLSLKEQTKSTRDALVNAFGASFTDEILGKVKSGEITTKQALEEIAKKSQEVGLSQQQNAQLTADVFRGAGEDVGGALKIFEAVAQSSQREMSESAKAALELKDANDRLNKAQAELFEINGFGDMWTGIKTTATLALVAILEYIADVKRDAKPLIDLIGVVFVFAWENLKNIVVNAFEIISGVVKSFASFFGGIISAIGKLIKGDFVGAFFTMQTAISSAFKHIGNIFIGLYNNTIGFLQKLVDAASPLLKSLGVDVDLLRKKLEGFKLSKFEIKGSVKIEENIVSNKPDDNKPKPKPTEETEEERNKRLKAEKEAREKAEKEAEKARKQREKEEADALKAQMERAKALSAAMARLGKAELDNFLANNRSKLEGVKQLTPELIAEETKRLETIKAKQIAALEEDKKNQTERAWLDAKSQEEFYALKEAIDLEYQTKKQGLELEFQKTTDQLKSEYEAEQKALKAEQLALENELEIATAEGKFEEDRIKEEQRLATELARYKQLLADKKITQEQYDQFETAAKEKSAKTQQQIEVQKAAVMIGALSQMADALQAVFGQNKELASAQAFINGALAITSIWSAQSMGTAAFDFALKAAQSVAVAATTFKNIRDINSAKAPKKPKFFYGGFTGSNPSLGYDEYGPVTGVVHEDEYVVPAAMTQNPRYANTIAWLENERTGKLRKFADGGGTTPGAIPQMASSAAESQMFIETMMALNATLQSGIVAKAHIGYEDQIKLNNLGSDLEQSEQNGIL